MLACARADLVHTAGIGYTVGAQQSKSRECGPMVHVTYKIVRHEDGWAYTVNGVFSESFPTHAQALQAARRAAVEQRQPGQTEGIEYEDEKGRWHREVSPGSDRPETDVDDTA